MENNILFWHRRDFRLEDNHGLYKALNSDGKVIPIFIFDGKPPIEKKDLLDKRRVEKDKAEKIYNELIT